MDPTTDTRAAAPGVTDVEAGLRQREKVLLEQIGEGTAMRERANEMVAAARRELKDVRRMLNAAHPRTRTRKPKVDKP